MQRRVAEDHVEELTGIVAHALGGQPNPHGERAIADVVDTLPPTNDFRQDLLVVDGGQRHLDALLDGDGLRPGSDVLGGTANLVSDGKPGAHGFDTPRGTTSASTAIAPAGPRITGLMSMASSPSPSASAVACRFMRRSTKARAASRCRHRGLESTRPRDDFATPALINERLTGSGNVATSCNASAKMPPRPATSTIPTPSARVTPAMASRSPAIIPCTTTVEQ